MRINSNGQVTIPREIREQLGLLPGTYVIFDVDYDVVRLRKADGDAVLSHLRGVRRSNKLSTDEIMALTRGKG